MPQDTATISANYQRLLAKIDDMTLGGMDEEDRERAQESFDEASAPLYATVAQGEKFASDDEYYDVAAHDTLDEALDHLARSVPGRVDPRFIVNLSDGATNEAQTKVIYGVRSTSLLD